MEIIIIPIIVLITLGMVLFEKLSSLFEKPNKSTNTQSNLNAYSDEQINIKK